GMGNTTPWTARHHLLVDQRPRETGHPPLEKIILARIDDHAPVHLDAYVVASQSPHLPDDAGPDRVEQDGAPPARLEIVDCEARPVLLQETDVVHEELHSVLCAPVDVEQ